MPRMRRVEMNLTILSGDLLKFLWTLSVGSVKKVLTRRSALYNLRKIRPSDMFMSS